MKVLSILPLLLFYFFQTATAQLIWPGDVNNNGIVNEVDLLTLGKAYGKEGPIRPSSSNEWLGQEVVNWQDTFPNGINFAYADCNGDGFIDGEDVLIIKENLGLIHNDVPFIRDPILSGIPGVSPSLRILEEDLSIGPDDKEKSINLGLGNMTIPVDSITGISFLVKVNPGAFDIQATDFKFKGWLDNGNSEVIQKVIPLGRSAPGDFLFAYTVTDGMPISSAGNGLIGTLVLSPSITEVDVLNLKVSIDSITMVDLELNPIPVFGTEVTFEVADSLLPNNTMLNTTICEGDTLAFNQQQLTTSGMYRDTFINQFGLDSFVVLNLVVADTFQTTVAEVICQGESLPFNGQNLLIAGTYRDTLVAANGCDSFIVLNLMVSDTVQTVLTENVCEGQAYTFNSQSLSVAGTYQDTLVATSGCDSFIVLNLIVNDTAQTVLTENICEGQTHAFNGQSLSVAGIYRDTLTISNGCDSFIVLNLNILDELTTNFSASTCADSPYFFNGQNLTMAGSYQDTLLASSGCDSIIILELILATTAPTVLNTTFCEGSSMLFNQQAVATTGIYRDTLTSSIGCDSFIVLNLEVLSAYRIELAETICQGESCFFKNTAITNAGIYRDTLTATSGCDSILILNLSVIAPSETTLITRICEGANLSFNGQVLATSGTYRDTLSNVYGCDSVIVLELTVQATFTRELTETICAGETYFFNNLPLTNSGIYTADLTAVNGCDSTVTLDLSVAATPYNTMTETICDGEGRLFKNETLTTSGIYYDTLQTVNGCDSFLQLDLTILPNYETIIDSTICPGDTVVFLNFVLTTQTTYWTTFIAVNGCDSVIVFNLFFEDIETTHFASTICAGDTLMFQGMPLTMEGIYQDTLQTITGCDSILAMTLTIEENCQTVSIVETLLNQIKIYPNPTNQYLSIHSPTVGMTNIQLMNRVGQVVFHQSYIPYDTKYLTSINSVFYECLFPLYSL